MKSTIASIVAVLMFTSISPLFAQAKMDYSKIATKITKEPNTDRPGGDYKSSVAQTPEICSDLCLKDTMCLSYTWIPVGYKGSKQAACFLKNAVKPSLPNLSTYSGAKQ